MQTTTDQLQKNWQDAQRVDGPRVVVPLRWSVSPGELPAENIELVCEHGTVIEQRSPRSAEMQAPPLAALPKFVNAHTHLEFSSRQSPLDPPRPFPDWIRSVIAWRTEQRDDVAARIESGLRESHQSGVSLIGEIETAGHHYESPSTHGLRGIAFREFIGLSQDRVAEQLRLAEAELLRPIAGGWQRGLSPHAPYTVHPDLLDELVTLSGRANVPVTMHVAETTDEIELLRSARGPLADFLQSLGLFEARTFGRRSVLDILQSLSRCPRALVVHGNYLTRDEVAFLSVHPQLTVVYCPRTHAWFQHAEHPLWRLRDAGVRVVLGTDSRASNPDLSIWRELQFVARRHPEIPPGELLQMITTEAAVALGADPTPYQIRVGSKLTELQLATVSDDSSQPLLLRLDPIDP